MGGDERVTGGDVCGFDREVLRYDGPRMRRRPLIIQFETWLMLSPVTLHMCFFSISLGYGCAEWLWSHALRKSVVSLGSRPRFRCGMDCGVRVRESSRGSAATMGG